MAAPLAKAHLLPLAGIIITASVLVAAGLAFYENEQFREWILNSRRKIAMALHSLGDEISPHSPDNDDEPGAEARRRRREEIIRLNRLELVRQARAEGIAVDLDELMAIGREEGPSRADRSRSFDEMVGDDGMLKKEPEMAQTSGLDASAEGIRRRGTGSSGLDMGVGYANPFDDEAQILFDRDLIGAEEESQHDERTRSSRESTRTLSPSPRTLFETSEAQSQYYSEDEMDAQIEEAIRRSLDDLSSQPLESVPPIPASDTGSTIGEAMALDPPISVPSSTEGSFYYAPPPNVRQPPLNGQSMYSSAMEAMLEANLYHDDAEAPTPPGTLTPTEDGYSTSASMVASNAEDIAVMSDFHSMMDENERHDLEMDARSEAASSDTFSMVGASTPGSWTDVESEAGEEEGHQGPSFQGLNVLHHTL